MLSNDERKEFLQIQHRAEQLLLYKVYDRMIHAAPPRAEDIDDEDWDKGSKEKYQRYYDGYYEALDTLWNTIKEELEVLLGDY